MPAASNGAFGLVIEGFSIKDTSSNFIHNIRVPSEMIKIWQKMMVLG